MKSFTQDDIKDKELLEKLINEEADRIYKSETARHNRSYDNIYSTVKQGKIAEMYLVESGRFKFADLKWHDLVSANLDGTIEYSEVKAYDVDDWNSPYVQRDIARYRSEKWCKSTWYYLFQYRNATYKLLAVLRIK